MIKDHNCLVLDMENSGVIPASTRHPAHDWWYTSYGGGHQLYDGWEPDGRRDNHDLAYDSIEGWVRQWHCPGREAISG